MDILSLAILALATWRLSSLLARESGPLSIFDKFRHMAGVRYNERSEMYGTNTLSEGILCIWCNSVWIGTALAILYYFTGDLAAWLSLPFALSSIAIFLDK